MGEDPIGWRHSAPLRFHNDAYLASTQMWQQKIVTEKDTLTDALAAIGSWLHFWNYICPGCPACSGFRKGKGKGPDQSMSGAVEPSDREIRRSIQNALWQTLERYAKKSGNGDGKGGKGSGKSKKRRLAEKSVFHNSREANRARRAREKECRIRLLRRGGN